jgi:hypothetical protein
MRMSAQCAETVNERTDRLRHNTKGVNHFRVDTLLNEFPLGKGNRSHIVNSSIAGIQ